MIGSFSREAFEMSSRVEIFSRGLNRELVSRLFMVFCYRVTIGEVTPEGVCEVSKN